MEPDEFKRMVLQFGQVKHVLSKSDRIEAYKISHALQQHFKRKLEDFALQFSQDPCALVLMSDGWGATVTETIKEQFPGSHLTVTRKGKFRHGFLLNRALFRTTSADGVTKLMALLQEPIGLSNGKKAWNVFVGNYQWLPVLRTLGCTRITISIYVADGCLFTALERKYLARHLLYYRCGLDLGPNAWYLQNADWAICIKCKSHGCSNGCHWGLKTVGGTTVVENAFIATASLVNGSTAIHLRVSPFVFRRIYFRVSTASVSDREAFWKMLGADPELTDHCSAIDLDWFEERLEVTPPH
jgi:hypothetical protein